MSEQPDKRRLFQKFLNNQCTEDELKQVLVCIQASDIPPEFEAVMEENLEQKLAAGKKLSSATSDRLLAGIQEKIGHPDQHKGKVAILSKRSLLSIAATVSLVLVAGWLYFYLPDLGNQTRVYETAYGEIENITLPDGSRVVLNANSSLSFSSAWKSQAQQDERFGREVWLKGEAYFEIEKLSRPTRFLVHTEQLKVEVLGTKFDVNSREQKTRVVLNEGKVKLLAQNQAEFVMSPGELVELTRGAAQFQKKVVNPENYISWRHDELIFEATPITEIIDILKYSYGYEVTVENHAVTQEMPFTGKVPADDIELLLNMLSESFNIRILQKDKKIIFR